MLRFLRDQVALSEILQLSEALKLVEGLDLRCLVNNGQDALPERDLVRMGAPLFLDNHV